MWNWKGGVATQWPAVRSRFAVKDLATVAEQLPLPCGVVMKSLPWIR